MYEKTENRFIVINPTKFNIIKSYIHQHFCVSHMQMKKNRNKEKERASFK